MNAANELKSIITKNDTASVDITNEDLVTLILFIRDNFKFENGKLKIDYWKLATNMKLLRLIAKNIMPILKALWEKLSK